VARCEGLINGTWQAADIFFNFNLFINLFLKITHQKHYLQISPFRHAGPRGAAG
jgi:hypothetical protein